MATEHLIESLGCYTKIAIIETPDDEDPATLLEIPTSISSFEYQMKHCLTSSK